MSVLELIAEQLQKLPYLGEVLYGWWLDRRCQRCGRKRYWHRDGRVVNCHEPIKGAWW